MCMCVACILFMKQPYIFYDKQTLGASTSKDWDTINPNIIRDSYAMPLVGQVQLLGVVQKEYTKYHYMFHYCPSIIYHTQSCYLRLKLFPNCPKSDLYNKEMYMKQVNIITTGNF